MTVCKACGDEISFAYLEKHRCATPNDAYEAERDKYRQAKTDHGARNERLGIAEIPGPPVWVKLEVFLTDGRSFRYIIPRDNFRFLNGRLMIEPVSKADWAERFSSSVVARYRVREFPDEAAAQAAASKLAGERTDVSWGAKARVGELTTNQMDGA